MSTYAPDDLLAVREYFNSETNLPANELGIAGDPAHAVTGGYHEGRDDLAGAGRLTSDYSVRESTRDRNGLTNAASAFDFANSFPRFREITLGIVAACERKDPRTKDIREIIYSPDGVNVKRWDALAVRFSGDSSHTFHTHTSFFRDSEGRRDREDNFLGLVQELFEGKEDEMKVTPSYEIKPGFAETTKPDPADPTKTVYAVDSDKVTVITIPSLKYVAAGLSAYARLVADNPGGYPKAKLRVAIRMDGTSNWDIRTVIVDVTKQPDGGNSFQLPANACGFSILRQPIDASDPGNVPVSVLVEYY